MGKYQSKSVDGFPSKLEKSVYEMLLLQEKCGAISDLKRQHNVHLTKSKILFQVDFSFIENGERVYCEAKGFETAVYRIKRRLWKNYGPGELRVFKGNYRKLILSECIFPEVGNE